MEFTVENTQPAALPAPTVHGTIVSRLDLPSGGWVELRDPTNLRAKDKKRVLGNIQDTARLVAAGLDVVDGMILLLVEKWQVPYLPSAPVPGDQPELVDELTIPDYDALVEAVEPARAVLFPAPATPDGMGKPGSPTPPASV